MPIVKSSTYPTPPEDLSRLFPRKGGGGAGGQGGHSSGHGGRAAGKDGARATHLAKDHGASREFLDSRGLLAIGIPGTKAKAMPYANGGGKRVSLGADSPFSGRLSGGGSRSTIFGTSHFGSGYPYGGYGTFVSSRPFPYYFYPVPVSHGYYGGDEYLNVSDTQRPGGNLVTAIVRPSSNQSGVTFRLVGDNSSVTTVFDALVANCSVANSSSAIESFSPAITTWPRPEQIVQYYRASSFALSFDSYNNTATRLVNAPASNDTSVPRIPDSPLPPGLNMTFLECINSTIGSSVPLADVRTSKLSGGAIAGIVVGGIAGLAILTLIIMFCCPCCRSVRSKSSRYSEMSRR